MLPQTLLEVPEEWCSKKNGPGCLQLKGNSSNIKTFAPKYQSYRGNTVSMRTRTKYDGRSKTCVKNSTNLATA